MEGLLRAALDGAAGTSAPGSMPRLDGLDPAEVKDLAQHADKIWKFLDTLAESDPEDYKRFVESQAKAAGVGKESAAPAGASPVAVLLCPVKAADAASVAVCEILLCTAQKGEGLERGCFCSSRALLCSVCARASRAMTAQSLFTSLRCCALRPSPHAGTSMPQATVAGGQPVTATTSSWQGLKVHFSSMPPPPPPPTPPGSTAAQQPQPPVPIHRFMLRVHPADLDMAVADSPAGFRALFVEAASQFVEDTAAAAARPGSSGGGGGGGGMKLDRRARRLQVLKRAVGPEALKALTAEAAMSASAGVASDLPTSLITQLAQMTTPSSTQRTMGRGAAALGGGASSGPLGVPKRGTSTSAPSGKPLIQEL